MPGCGGAHTGPCPMRQQRKRQADARRPSPREQGYDSRWEKARRIYLAQHPLCVRCEQQGRVTLAVILDHTIPHKGNVALFWNEKNWEGLCVHCNAVKTASEDGAFGNPIRHTE